MENWQLAIVIVVSIFVGAMLPLIVLLAAAVNGIRGEIRTTSENLHTTLEAAEKITLRVEKVSRGLEGGEEKVARMMDALGEISGVVERLKGSIKVASAIGTSVGPAVAAFVSGMRSASEQVGAPPQLEAGDGRSAAAGEREG